MGNIKLENLNDEPISFDLTEEDLKAIKGGATAPIPLSIGGKRPFPTCIHGIHVIIITALPPHLNS